MQYNDPMHRQKVLSKAQVIALILLLFALLGLSTLDKRPVSSSVEVQFKDMSRSGLAIVPASCPSYPDYQGQCGYCAIRAQDYFVDYGGSTRLYFNTSDDPQEATIDQGIGTVASPSSANGFAVTNLTTTRSYTMTAGTYSCTTAAITVCAPGQTGSSVGCVSQCSGDGCAGGGCPEGTHWGGSACVADTAYCPDNSPAPNNSPSQCTCVHGNLSKCPNCPANTHMQDGACVVNTPEVVSFDAVYSNPPAADQHFTATGDLQVVPQLVRQGDIVRVYWNVTHVDNCTVTPDNGTDHWTAEASGAAGVPSGPIMQRTTYTLHCDAFTGANPPIFEETATVNVIPVFQEL
jgi:hypothetical protein